MVHFLNIFNRLGVNITPRQIKKIKRLTFFFQQEADSEYRWGNPQWLVTVAHVLSLTSISEVFLLFLPTPTTGMNPFFFFFLFFTYFFVQMAARCLLLVNISFISCFVGHFLNSLNSVSRVLVSSVSQYWHGLDLSDLSSSHKSTFTGSVAKSLESATLEGLLMTR